MKRCTILLLIAFVLGGAAQLSAQRKSADYFEFYSGEITMTNYLVTGSTNEHLVFANTIDNLIEYDQFGIVRPGLAASWTNSADGLVWTFQLRKGVKWLTWEGKEYGEVVAQDWVDAAKYIMTKANASKTADVIYNVVKNGEAFWEGKVTDFAEVGVKAKDKYTLEYTLARPVPYFVSMLSYVSFLPLSGKFLAEAGAKFGTDNKTILYNGAYIFSGFEPQVTRVFTKNEKYWDKGNVNIKRLVYKYNKEAGTLGPELFLRGENSFTSISSAIIDSWMKDPVKKLQVHPSKVTSSTFFYTFNFNPKFAPEYQPENWKVAVNSKAFRKAIFHALDRRAAMLTWEPYSPDRRLSNTVTPRNFASAGGKDYVDTGDLGLVSKVNTFDKAKALQLKAQAMKELAGKATFPVKIPMPFRGDNVFEWANRVQVVEQQLEGLLGADFIDVIPLSYPATGFLGATRRNGNNAMQECNWGPDYADPETYTDPFVTGSNYNWPELAEGYMGPDGKTPIYEGLVDNAKKETKDLKKRFELFAKAEAYLLGEAFVIPFSVGGGGFEASKLEPFTCPFAPFGLSDLKFKGQIVLPKALSMEEYQSLESKWTKGRLEALVKAKN
jgi:oligopeptide transport system substrate-binding protein